MFAFVLIPESEALPPVEYPSTPYPVPEVPYTPRYPPPRAHPPASARDPGVAAARVPRGAVGVIAVLGVDRRAGAIRGDVHPDAAVAVGIHAPPPCRLPLYSVPVVCQPLHTDAVEPRGRAASSEYRYP